MDVPTIETAIAQAKADVDEMQVDGMVVVDAWVVVAAVLARLPSGAAVAQPPADKPAAAG